ncbi:PTS transporter subunit EIIC [uncultured Vagococcus sp.]|uniref:PTS sugar transporter subunit IIC n=1 Tax=uncultured Vagococcus sp. TaxID=189676 RepID=UPI0028D021A8|nr:PTS transporter subunit EIIC [uncultured Vagococcus sp.]
MEFNMEKLNTILEKIGQNPYLKSITSGMMHSLPVTIIGSIASILMNLPIATWNDFVQSSNLSTIFDLAMNVTTNMLSIYIVFFITKALTERLSDGLDGTNAAVTAIISFLILTPLQITEGEMGPIKSISFDWIGSKGIFSALLVAFVVSKVYQLSQKNNLTIKMPDSVPPMITSTFEGLIPGVMASMLMLIISWLFSLTSFGNIHEFIYSNIQTPLQGLGTNIWSLVIASIISQLLWFFGIHGTSILLPILLPLLLPLDAENLAAYAAGQPLPNITGFAFFLFYTSTGMAMGLIVMMLFAKSKQYKTLGKLSIIPAICGITEPVIFGTPLVLNFRFFLPFVFSNSIALIIAYFATFFGLVPALNGSNMVMGMPLFLTALMQGGWRTLVLLIVLFVITSVLWIPGFRKVDQEAFLAESGEL